MFAGVAAGVVLPPPNKDVACGPALLGMLGCADALWFASFDASLFPKPNGLALLAAGCAGVEAPPNRLGVDDVAAGFAAPPKSDGAAFAPAAAWPNRLVPGGGPAGVVEGSEKVLLGAGVAVGVEDSAILLKHVH